jgi:hypothetical protein
VLECSLIHLTIKTVFDVYAVELTVCVSSRLQNKYKALRNEIASTGAGLLEDDTSGADNLHGMWCGIGLYRLIFDTES